MKKSSWCAWFILCCCLSMFVGCASWRNDIAHKGGLFTEYCGDYVVISASGGIIMDVWVLEDVYVESEKSSDGWRFIDRLGQPTNVGGDAKVIRIKNKAELKNYYEYHFERESVPYSVFFQDKVCSRYHLRKRVSDFFDRSTQLAGRYWQRGRVKSFFDRNRGQRRGRSRRVIA